MKPLTLERWAVVWRQKRTAADPTRDTHFIFESPCRQALFLTRREANAFVSRKYGYIAKREDLRRAPHFWRMPKPVRVTLTCEVAP